MTHTDRDKAIAEALNIHWHIDLPRTQEQKDTLNGDWYCSCGQVYRVEDYPDPMDSQVQMIRHIKTNPNFSTFDGMGLILNKGPEALGERQWNLFIRGLYLNLNIYTSGYEYTTVMVIILQTYFQDPDKLADELYAFLQKEGG